MAEASKEATGGCLCGAFRFRVTGPPIRVEICHCATCRRSTGAAFATFALFRGENVMVESGDTVAFASSENVRRHGCRRCGSPLFNSFARSSEIDVHVGTMDDPDALVPQSEIWCERRLRWLGPIAAPH